MYAIVDIGGKQYRAEVGEDLIVDRVKADEGDTVEFRPVLIVGDEGVQTANDATGTVVSARVVEHLRGPKLRVFRFKPKRGYSRTMGFRSALTRLSVDKIG
jgi:large subunit ribosomal protein L21